MNKNKFRQNKQDRDFERFERVVSSAWDMVNSLINLKKEIHQQKEKQNGN